jgi:hypothetical protein
MSPQNCASNLFNQEFWIKAQYGKTLPIKGTFSEGIIKVKTFNSRTKHPYYQSHIQDGSLTYETLTQWFYRIVKYEITK